MQGQLRPEVKIPDHEVLRKIGGGSYGEVWLARGVTGAWRAVKVVWRGDFDDERGFEREFEGILKFEPISRDHPGLVNVLHVGRSKEGEDDFYYYVMELGDDVRTGHEIHPVEYEARTLRSDLLSADGNALDVGFCIETGIRLSDALHHLHENGLAHRDVKPSNVIFVGGKAKLADIGLVAARGQMTFVGTEGFVPPEGPGSAQADVYSLGKVLYEMVTGKDRLQFPELPDEMPAGDARKQVLAFNQVICDVCEPRLTKRTIKTAGEMSEALSRMQRGKRLKNARRSAMIKMVFSAVCLSLALGLALYYKPWQLEGISFVVDSGNGARAVPDVGPKNEVCAIQIKSDPPYATVYENGLLLEQVTPTDYRDFKPGTRVEYRLELVDHRPVTKVVVVPDQPEEVLSVKFEKFSPPRLDVPWTDPLGNFYLPKGEVHLSGFISKRNFNQFLSEAPGAKDLKGFKFIPYSENGEKLNIALMTDDASTLYAEWIEKKALSNGLLESSQMIAAERVEDLAATGYGDVEKKAGLLPVRCVAKAIPWASLQIVSDPVGARVYIDDEWRGVTPMPVEKIRPGKVKVELSRDGYKKSGELLNLAEKEDRRYSVKLQPNNGVVFGKAWKNSLGVPMVPVGDGLMVSVWEVRKKDFELFTNSTGYRTPKNPGFVQGPDHPVVGVNREDAEKFCDWLTTKARGEDRIGLNHRYRLPTDAEWSLLFDVEENPDWSPWKRYFMNRNISKFDKMYLWDGGFPPPENVGNLADEAAAKAPGMNQKNTIIGYDDRYENTAPVGKFPPNKLGIYDLCGNAYEWMAEDYREEGNTGVVRGGSWATHARHFLLVRWRLEVSLGLRDNQYGFRVVLVDESDDVVLDE